MLQPTSTQLSRAHRALHSQPGDVLCLPLLLQRSDFMVAADVGPRLVECNSIAAGMAPFGERMGLLHQYLQQRWPTEYARLYSCSNPGQAGPGRERAGPGRAEPDRGVGRVGLGRLP